MHAISYPDLNYKKNMRQDKVAIPYLSIVIEKARLKTKGKNKIFSQSFLKDY